MILQELCEMRYAKRKNVDSLTASRKKDKPEAYDVYVKGERISSPRTLKTMASVKAEIRRLLRGDTIHGKMSRDDIEYKKKES